MTLFFKTTNDSENEPQNNLQHVSSLNNNTKPTTEYRGGTQTPFGGEYRTCVPVYDYVPQVFLPPGLKSGFMAEYRRRSLSDAPGAGAGAHVEGELAAKGSRSEGVLIVIIWSMKAQWQYISRGSHWQSPHEFAIQSRDP